MPRALITGVTGQDGWYLSELLQQAGYTVAGMRHADDPLPPPPGVEEVTGDLTHLASLEAVFDAVLPDEVYNLGGISSVALSWENPVLVGDVNGLGLLRLVEAARRVAERGGPHARIVQASSGEIFGDAPPPQDESTPLNPRHPYGLAKAMAHQAARIYRASGVPVSTAILYNHESPRRPANFVTRRITQGVARIAKGGTDKITLGNLEARRDWGHASDVVRALHLIATHPEPDEFVVATGTSHSVADFVASAFRHVGIEQWRDWVAVDPSLLRKADAADLRGNAAKAARVLGWRPEITFDQMVAEMVDADLARLE